MICLSIHQPQAALLACGRAKWHERSWTTGYRGPVVIHASDQVGAQDFKKFENPRARAAFRQRCAAWELADAPRG